MKTLFSSPKTAAWLEAAALAALIVSLLLPWFGNSFFSLPGYSIGQLPQQVKYIIFDIDMPAGTDLLPAVLYLVYLLPLAALAALLLPRRRHLLSFLTGFLGLFLIVLIFWNRFYLLHLARSGFYTLLAATVLLLVVPLLAAPAQWLPASWRKAALAAATISLAAFLFLTAPHPFPAAPLPWNVSSTRTTLVHIMEGLERCVKDYGYVPAASSYKELVEVKVNGVTFGRRYMLQHVTDRWNREIRYQADGRGTRYFLASDGEDGRPGTADDIYPLLH